MAPQRLSQSLTFIVCAAVLLRFFAFAATPVPSFLTTRPELATPITSYRSLKEGVILHNRGINAYQGGVFHHSPLYLALFTHMMPDSYLASCIFWTASDIVGALALVAAARILRVTRKTIVRPRDAQVALVYLFNPYTVMTCLARSTTSIDNAIMLLAFYSASAGLDIFACASLSIASHTSLYPVLTLPAMLMTLVKTSNAPLKQGVKAFVMFTVFACFLGVIGRATTGRAWVGQTWGTILGVTELTPNSGLWWYFFTEMFDHFRPFFVGVFHLHNLIYVLPICLRLRSEPMLAMAVTTGVFCTWKSYPSVGDLGLWAGLLSCFPDVIRDLRHPLFTITVYLYTLILLPLLHSLWLLTGTGNANFFYAATMVHGLNSSLAVVDVLGATIRRRTKDTVGDKWNDDRWQVVQLNKMA